MFRAFGIRSSTQIREKFEIFSRILKFRDLQKRAKTLCFIMFLAFGMRSATQIREKLENFFLEFETFEICKKKRAKT